MLSSVLRNCWHIYMWIKSAHCPNTFEMSHWATWQILFDPIPDTYLSSIILKHFICNEIFVCGLFICFPFAHHDANLFVLSKTDEINVNLLNFIKSVLFNAYYGRPLLMLDEFSSTVANIIYAVCSVQCVKYMTEIIGSREMCVLSAKTNFIYGCGAILFA